MDIIRQWLISNTCHIVDEERFWLYSTNTTVLPFDINGPDVAHSSFLFPGCAPVGLRTEACNTAVGETVPKPPGQNPEDDQQFFPHSSQAPRGIHDPQNKPTYNNTLFKYILFFSNLHSIFAVESAVAGRPTTTTGTLYTILYYTSLLIITYYHCLSLSYHYLLYFIIIIIIVIYAATNLTKFVFVFTCIVAAMSLLRNQAYEYGRLLLCTFTIRSNKSNSDSDDSHWTTGCIPWMPLKHRLCGLGDGAAARGDAPRRATRSSVCCPGTHRTLQAEFFFMRSASFRKRRELAWFETSNN